MILLAACASPPAVEEDEAQIVAALKASTEAWNRGSLAGHVALYDPSVTMMTRQGPRRGVAPIEEAFSKTYFRDGKPKQQLSMEQVAIRMLSADSALVTGRFVLSGGVEKEQSGWFTLVWIRTPSGWKVVHDHTS
ncbi:MAG TPA: nuclear transport factor 2 family protein [Burkholderiales bacterium]|nr:nuclear transport factor 2 family protein [Burkholderiales bacterium]